MENNKPALETGRGMKLKDGIQRQGSQEMVEVIEHWRKNKDGEIVHYECFEGPKNPAPKCPKCGCYLFITLGGLTDCLNCSLDGVT